MKRFKQRDGYVLAMVMVVVVILGVLTTGCLTAAMRNLETQQASVQRSKDLYEAEGDIEAYRASMIGKTAPPTAPPYVSDSANNEKETVNVHAEQGSVQIDAVIGYEMGSESEEASEEANKIIKTWYKQYDITGAG